MQRMDIRNYTSKITGVSTFTYNAAANKLPKLEYQLHHRLTSGLCSTSCVKIFTCVTLPRNGNNALLPPVLHTSRDVPASNSSLHAILYDT
jgi:hypothetical protein